MFKLNFFAKANIVLLCCQTDKKLHIMQTLLWFREFSLSMLATFESLIDARQMTWLCVVGWFGNIQVFITGCGAGLPSYRVNV